LASRISQVAKRFRSAAKAAEDRDKNFTRNLLSVLRLGDAVRQRHYRSKLSKYIITTFGLVEKISARKILLPHSR
jgi:hypothetical protein